MANLGVTGCRWITAKKLASELGYKSAGGNGLGRMAKRVGANVAYWLPSTGEIYGDYREAQDDWKVHGGRPVHAVYKEEHAELIREVVTTVREKRSLGGQPRHQPMYVQIGELQARVSELEDRVRVLEEVKLGRIN